MALTNERVEILMKYLVGKGEESYGIFELDVNEAVAKINADGYDFNAEELHDFADLMEISQKKGELDESSLDEVSGGALFTTTISTISWIAKQFTNRKFRVRW